MLEKQRECCLNRPFSRSTIHRLEVRNTENVGYELFCTSKIKKGNFICEYVGDVLKKKEFMKIYEKEKKEKEKTQLIYCKTE